jgi:hypothetical protein
MYIRESIINAFHLVPQVLVSGVHLHEGIANSTFPYKMNKGLDALAQTFLSQQQ